MAKMLRDIVCIGDKVVLYMDEGDKKMAPKGLRAMIGQEFVVLRRKYAGKNKYYCELDGCVSPAGIPYALLEEWLVPSLV